MFFFIFFGLKVYSIFCLIRCVEVSIFCGFDVLMFRCFVFQCLVIARLCIVCNTLYTGNTLKSTLANSQNPDEMLQYFITNNGMKHFITAC